MRHPFLSGTMYMMKEILVSVLPIFLVDLSTASNDFTNAAIVSNFSPKEDFGAAASIIFSMQAAYISVPSAFLYTISFTIRPYKAEDNLEKKRAIITNGLILGFVVSLPTLVLAYFTGRIFSHIGTSQEICNIIDDYYSVFAFSLPPMMMAISLHQAAIGLDKQYWLYASGFINLVSTLGMSLLFTKIYPLASLSNIKIVALSFLLGSGIIRLAFYGMVFKCHGLLEAPNASMFTTNQEQLKDMFSKGGDICIQILSELGALNMLPFLTELLLPNQTVNLSILNAMNQYFFFYVIFTYALGQATSNRVIELYTEEKYDLVRPYVHSTLGISTLYSIVYIIIGLVMPRKLASLFLDPRENNNTGMSGSFRAMFCIVFFSLLPNAYREILGMVLRPMDVYKPQEIASIVALWGVGIPSSIILAKYTNLGVAGILMGFYLGTTVGSMYVSNLWFSHKLPDNRPYGEERCKSVMYQGIATLSSEEVTTPLLNP